MEPTGQKKYRETKSHEEEGVGRGKLFGDVIGWELKALATYRRAGVSCLRLFVPTGNEKTEEEVDSYSNGNAKRRQFI